ncbi:MAG TPA: hypothetical protein VNZ27_06440 [Rhodanobacter sp.]|jgi:hypothetical protein|nr:hypothetical protein [Rhodanobacter sp.]
MPSIRKSPVSYAPRGVTKKAIALRLLAPELAKHESLAEQNGKSSASFARQMYLRGVKSYQRAAAIPLAACGMNTTTGVNRA